MATRDLRSAIDAGSISPNQFNAEQLAAIPSGKSEIPDNTWHHQDSGRMQLVPFDEHNKVGHVGGGYMGKGN